MKGDIQSLDYALLPRTEFEPLNLTNWVHGRQAAVQRSYATITHQLMHRQARLYLMLEPKES